MAKSRPNLLVVDERALVRRMIAMALKSNGMSILEAANGTQALDLLRKGAAVDLIVATIEMADMSGVELTRILKSESRFQDIPVILRARGEDFEADTLQSRVSTILKSGASKTRRVLVLSTSTETKSQLRRALVQEGFRVFEVSDPDEAARVLDDVDGLDLAFVDFRLASNQATEFIRRVRSEGRARSLRLVMLMSELNVGQILEGVRGGVDHYLLQPVSRETLLGRLKDLGLDGPCGEAARS